MAAQKIKDVKKGEIIFLLNKKGEAQKKAWVRDEYNRSLKKYELHNYWDVNDFKDVKGDSLCVEADI